jgi:deazaflavin-dependent oxidoreductase (nitroreductase family)
MRVNRWLERIYGASSTRPPRRLIRAVGAIHRFAIVRSGGRLGTVLLDHPILLLSTVGRRSGKRRTQPLMYVREAGGYLVAASFGGHDKDPAWVANIKANPEATIVVEGSRMPVSATITTPDERERLWPHFLSLSAGYEKYQRSTDRKIPIVRLRPLVGLADATDAADHDGSEDEPERRASEDEAKAEVVAARDSEQQMAGLVQEVEKAGEDRGREDLG